MALVHYRFGNQTTPLEQLRQEMNEILDFPTMRIANIQRNAFVPAVDISEDKDNIYVDVDAPGFDQKNINVHVKGDILTIAGKREETSEEHKRNFHKLERIQGNFVREISLAVAVDQSKIKALYRSGVLRITLPKKEEAKEKEININVE